MLASSNTVAWVDIGTLTQKHLFGAATQGGQLVLAGIEGVILRSSIQPVMTLISIQRFAVSPPTK